MGAVAPLYPVDGPQPSRRPYTIMGAADVAPFPAEYAQAGVVTYPYPTDVPGVWAACVGSPAAVKSADRPPAGEDFDSYAVVGGMECSTKGALRDGSLADFQARLRTAFLANEDAAVEKVLWHGLTLDSTIPSLASEAVLADGTTTHTTILGIATLEQWIANTFGSRGILHMSPGMTTVAKAKGIIEYASVSGNNRIGTINGTLVVPGAGYDGSAPAGQTAISGTTEWVYASGPVSIYRSDAIDLPSTEAEAITRPTNDLTIYVERYYAHAFDTQLVAAVKIDRAT